MLGSVEWRRSGCMVHKVKSLLPHYGFVIALHSPDGVVETGLVWCPPEKNAAKLTRSIQDCTFSGPVLGQEKTNCAYFSRFSEKFTRNSLHFRLCGGARGIRTLGPVLPR
jgi:hypothetical protein